VSLGPAALVASLPGALGHTPEEKVALIGVTPVASEVASVALIDVGDVPTERDAEELASAVLRAVEAAVTDGVTFVVVIAYAEDAAPDSTAARVAATAVVCAEANGLRVLDALAVSRGRWWSYDCTDSSCCPPEGTPIQEGPTS